MTAETIFALSSGQPPAAIAIVRISGSRAKPALQAMVGSVPEARAAGLRTIRHPVSGETLDRGVVLFFPGPNSATGEDVAELHLHGGRSVVSGALEALALVEGLRPALAGEFTRRAFENGRIDLAEAEGLADLLAAETHSQRRAALSLAGGRLSRCIEGWQDQVLGLSAGVEALLDFSDEGDVADVLPASWSSTLDSLISELESVRRSPPIERLRDGVRVVIAGPPNAGKSSLLNWLVGRQAAITSATPGTTRDAIEAPTAIGGAPFLLVDTAGLRDSSDEIEAVGVALAREHVSAADIILWLGAAAERPPSERAIIVGSKADLCGPLERPQADIHVSTKTGEGMSQLVTMLVERSRAILPGELEVSINTRHRDVLTDAVGHLITASREQDLLIRAEALRLARASLDRVTGRVGVEAMLDRLFGSFCIGK